VCACGEDTRVTRWRTGKKLEQGSVVKELKWPGRRLARYCVRVWKAEKDRKHTIMISAVGALVDGAGGSPEADDTEKCW
jgi:hypothetical protein